MSLQFLRGNPQAPKGHAIFVARSTTDSRSILSTYCVVHHTAVTRKVSPIFFSFAVIS